MEPTELHYTASLDCGVMRNRLVQLIRTGALVDEDLESRIRRLNERFRTYAASFPLGLWAPGLVITREMRVVTEVYLPLAEIRAAFRRLLKISLHHSPFLAASAIEVSAGWLDVLHHLHPLISGPDPSCLLRRLMEDPEFRGRFLFALFLPRRYGGGFGRYPLQTSFLQGWLRQVHHRPLKCLDAACGSGEGTYELALLLRQAGFSGSSVQGVTIDPLEVFAAAHACFPNDPERQARYRQTVREVFTPGSATEVIFALDDLRTDDGSAGHFDVILCNGLLGGPLLNERGALEKAMRRLCRMLKQGGILLAADRFHQGWRRTITDAVLRQILAENGLTMLAVGEGVAGVNTGE